MRSTIPWRRSKFEVRDFLLRFNRLRIHSNTSLLGLPKGWLITRQYGNLKLLIINVYRCFVTTVRS